MMVGIVVESNVVLGSGGGGQWESVIIAQC